MRLSFVKTTSGLFAPYGEESQKAMAKLKTGQLVGGEFAATRNYMFHKKFFTLVQLGFDIWSETAPVLEYKGENVYPEIGKFRSDVTILAGYYVAHVNIDGEVRLEAKSISFARMDETEFEALYSSVINVILARCFKGGMTEEQMRARVDQVLAYDA